MTFDHIRHDPTSIQRRGGEWRASSLGRFLGGEAAAESQHLSVSPLTCLGIRVTKFSIEVLEVLKMLPHVVYRQDGSGTPATAIPRDSALIVRYMV